MTQESKLHDWHCPQSPLWKHRPPAMAGGDFFTLTPPSNRSPGKPIATGVGECWCGFERWEVS